MGAQLTQSRQRGRRALVLLRADKAGLATQLRAAREEFAELRRELDSKLSSSETTAPSTGGKTVPQRRLEQLRTPLLAKRPLSPSMLSYPTARERGQVRRLTCPIGTPGSCHRSTPTDLRCARRPRPAHPTRRDYPLHRPAPRRQPLPHLQVRPRTEASRRPPDDQGSDCRVDDIDQQRIGLLFRRPTLAMFFEISIVTMMSFGSRWGSSVVDDGTDFPENLREQLAAEVNDLRELAITSSDPLVVSKAIAVSDRGVQYALLTRLSAGERLAEVLALQGTSFTELQVFFRFVPRDGGVKLTDTGLLAFVDMVKGEVVGTVDPYTLQRSAPSAGLSCWSPSPAAPPCGSEQPIVERERAFSAASVSVVSAVYAP